ncbi:MAG: ATP-binding protein [Candidatus Electryonea clarkiae]|nr:ATP-binding protein [Candidatus Electryonea clarkiae]MDP8287298.1 ATP-binding protein [Candidatus Electryonea clarkiae]
MTMRTRLLLYMIFLHLIFISVGIWALWENYRVWLLALEIILTLSLIIGIRLIFSIYFPVKMVTSGVDLIREKDFTHSFTEVGSVELKKLVRLYNEMISHLREERIHAQEQQAFLEKVLEASPAGIVTIDLDGCISHVNSSAAAFLESGAKILQGKKLKEVNTGVAEALSELEVGQALVVSIEGRRRIKCLHSQYFDTGFQHSFYLMIEVTLELWRSEKIAYDNLIRTIAHEVNNTLGATNSILRSCLSYANQLGETDREDFTNALEVAIERTDNLNAFMRSYADVIRLPDPVIMGTDLIKLLKRIIHLLEPECRKRKIRIEWNVDDIPSLVALDAKQIEQAVMNIMRNAIEAIESDGLITIHFTAENGGRILTFEDSGPGLSDEAKENLLVPFFSTKKHGQGIGLTLVNEILTRHHFEYSLTDSPGNPTRFSIRFSS